MGGKLTVSGAMNRAPTCSGTMKVVFNKGFDGRGRPSYATGKGLNGQESPTCRAVFIA